MIEGDRVGYWVELEAVIFGEFLTILMMVVDLNFWG